jgi:hypothetical protein
MRIASPAFQNGGRIPAKYTCDGENISPPLKFSDIPEDAACLVLIMDDPDVPRQIREDRMFDHWVVFNIDSSVRNINENSVPKVSVLGRNTAGSNRYTGPCPPSQYEPKEHRYFFRLYALSSKLDLEEGVSKKEVEHAMNGKIIGNAEIIGRYSRQV